MGKIDVVNIGKAYKNYENRWSRLLEWTVPFSRPRHKLNWILQNINFKITSGESVGIVGINGAGKSTLLKLITGTTQPTTGKVAVSGRISAMLELGMGFHPDFTGRQNVMMAAQLQGFGAEKIDRLMPQIEDYAEIGDYIDQPVRVYSSGMQMRLAFSVATASRPDILIVDEALSVGDTYFQHKSFDRIRKFREQGTTLLIVSHDKNSIQSLCDRAILLDNSQIVKEGVPEEVMDFYNALIAKKGNSVIRQEVMENGKVQTSSGTGEVCLKGIALYNNRGATAKIVAVGEPVELRVKVKVNQSVKNLVLGYSIKDRLGQVIYGTNTWHTGQVVTQPQTDDEYIFIISFSADFGAGSYSVAIALHDCDTHLTANYEWQDIALVFEVINIDKMPFYGCSWMESKIVIKKQ